jgi:N-acylneuraminate cytidylyltransferase/CMP-N,N'-diacetyllegionaminic acid synthase
LLDHTAEALIEAGMDALECLLSTDDQAIAERGRFLGWQVPWLRPSWLASDAAATIEAVIHALDWFGDAHGGDPERVMVLQPTSPLRGGACLVAAIGALDDRADIDAVVGMRHARKPDRLTYKVDAAGVIQPVEGYGELAPNGAVYLIRTTALRTHHSLYPPRTLALEMNEIASIDIDTEDDWRLAEAALTLAGDGGMRRVGS